MVLDMDPSISLPVLIPGVRVTGASQDTGHSHTHTQQRLRVSTHPDVGVSNQ